MKIPIYLLLPAFLSALIAEQGTIQQKNGKTIITGQDGKEMEVLQGKSLAAFFYKTAKHNFSEKKYDSATSGAISALNSMIASQDFDDTLISATLLLIHDIETATQKAISLESETMNAGVCSRLYVSYGGQQLQKQNYPLAKYAFEKSISYNPKNAKGYDGLGITHDLSGNFPAAEASYLKAIQLNPGDSGIYFNLACSYAMQKRKSEAFRQLETAFAKGYSIEAAKKDDTLANIKNEPEFAALIKKYAK